MAERVGFEPTEPFRVHYISNVANSTALAPFRKIKILYFKNRFSIQNRQSKIQNRNGGEGGI